MSAFYLYILHVLVAVAKTSLFAGIYTSLRYVSKFLNAHHLSFAYALRNVQNIRIKKLERSIILGYSYLV